MAWSSGSMSAILTGNAARGQWGCTMSSRAVKCFPCRRKLQSGGRRSRSECRCRNERAKVGRYRLEERIMAKFEISHCTIALLWQTVQGFAQAWSRDVAGSWSRQVRGSAGGVVLQGAKALKLYLERLDLGSSRGRGVSQLKGDTSLIIISQHRRAFPNTRFADQELYDVDPSPNSAVRLEYEVTTEDVAPDFPTLDLV